MEQSLGKKLFEDIKKEMSKNIIGNEELIKLLTIAILTEGHILLEGVPGIGKTTIAKTYGQLLNLEYKRIQMTPDTMPSDIIGFKMYDKNISKFRLVRGPIFSEILLVDEINRAPPKTQSALLEAMEEKTVTIDGDREELSDNFTVIATMNTVDDIGIYGLPNSQYDRFMFKINLEYLDEQREIELLKSFSTNNFGKINNIINKYSLNNYKREVKNILVSDEIIEYIQKIGEISRNDKRLKFGISTRALLQLLISSKGHAYLCGRNFVIPDDIIYLSKFVLPHRLKLNDSYEFRLNDFNEAEGFTSKEEIINEIINSIEVPK